MGVKKPWVRTVRAGSETLRDYGNGIIHPCADGSPEGNVPETLAAGSSTEVPGDVEPSAGPPSQDGAFVSGPAAGPGKVN